MHPLDLYVTKDSSYDNWMERKSLFFSVLWTVCLKIPAEPSMFYVEKGVPWSMLLMYYGLIITGKVTKSYL